MKCQSLFSEKTKTKKKTKKKQKKKKTHTQKKTTQETYFKMSSAENFTQVLKCHENVSYGAHLHEMSNPILGEK